MNQTKKGLEKQAYVTPKVEVIVIEPQGVICGSGIQGNSTEAVGIGEFEWG